MLSKEEAEEAESISFLEASKKKENEQNNIECIIIMDEETVCTVDEEDIEDNGSFCCEDDNSLVAQHDTQAASNTDNDIPDLLPRGRSGDENDDDDISVGTEISPPQSKQTRLMSPDLQAELNVLKLKYKRLFAKSENFRMTAAHWKTRYNQTLQSKVPMTEATRDSMTDQVMNDIIHSEGYFYITQSETFYLPQQVPASLSG